MQIRLIFLFALIFACACGVRLATCSFPPPTTLKTIVGGATYDDRSAFQQINLQITGLSVIPNGNVMYTQYQYIKMYDVNANKVSTWTILKNKEILAIDVTANGDMYLSTKDGSLYKIKRNRSLLLLVNVGWSTLSASLDFTFTYFNGQIRGQANGDLTFSLPGKDCVQKFIAATSKIETIAGQCESRGNSGDDPILAVNSYLYRPSGIVYSQTGDLFIADTANHKIRKILKNGKKIITIAGTGVSGKGEENQLATSSKLNLPTYLGINSQEELIFTEIGNNRVRKILSNNTIVTIATLGNYGDDGVFTTAANGDIFLASGSNLNKLSTNGNSTNLIKPYDPFDAIPESIHHISVSSSESNSFQIVGESMYLSSGGYVTKVNTSDGTFKFLAKTSEKFTVDEATGDVYYFYTDFSKEFPVSFLKYYNASTGVSREIAGRYVNETIATSAACLIVNVEIMYATSTSIFLFDSNNIKVFDIASSKIKTIYTPERGGMDSRIISITKHPTNSNKLLLLKERSLSEISITGQNEENVLNSELEFSRSLYTDASGTYFVDAMSVKKYDYATNTFTSIINEGCNSMAATSSKVYLSTFAGINVYTISGDTYTSEPSEVEKLPFTPGIDLSSLELSSPILAINPNSKELYIGHKCAILKVDSQNKVSLVFGEYGKCYLGDKSLITITDMQFIGNNLYIGSNFGIKKLDTTTKVLTSATTQLNGCSASDLEAVFTDIKFKNNILYTSIKSGFIGTIQKGIFNLLIGTGDYSSEFDPNHISLKEPSNFDFFSDNGILISTVDKRNGQAFSLVVYNGTNSYEIKLPNFNGFQVKASLAKNGNAFFTARCAIKMIEKGQEGSVIVAGSETCPTTAYMPDNAFEILKMDINPTNIVIDKDEQIYVQDNEKIRKIVNECPMNSTLDNSGECVCKEGYYGSLCSEFSCFGKSNTDLSVCSGNGVCIGPNACACYFNMFGSECGETACFGLSQTNPTVCSGKGNCTDYNFCTCESGHIGTQCEILSCFGVASDAPNVCSSRGTCNTPNNCTCYDGYYGESCNLFDCFGTPSTNSSVCSGKGSCLSPNSCKCGEHYNGSLCNNYDCDGINVFDRSVCSTHGKCVSFNKCACETGWFGSSCNMTSCFGISNANSSVCSENGVCNTPNNCTCYDGYYGENCNLFDCFGTPSTNSSVCSGKGICKLPNFCECLPNYNGSVCNNFDCYGINRFNESVCSTHGKCVSFNKCACETGWFGDLCELTNCNGLLNTNQSVCSSRGACLSKDTCSCRDKYFGSNCELFECFGTDSRNLTACSGHGLCVKPDTCSCESGWENDQCSKFTCTSLNDCNGNGLCVANNTCHCYSGWKENNCSTFSCENNCYGNGICVSNNTCNCKTGWIGIECEIATCFNISQLNSSVCSGTGACSSVDNCTCTDGYYGKDCSQFDCFGVPFGNSSTCSSSGECIALNQCKCKSGYLDADCSGFNCFNISHTNESACQGHGICTDIDKCSCEKGYYGVDCSQFECYGVEKNNDTVCTSRGKCSYPNQCDCDEYYYGDWCQFSNITCFGNLYSNDNVCSGRGKCPTYNKCECQKSVGNAFISGSNCEILTCFTDYYGKECETFCQNTANCNSHGSCMPTNGSCSCHSTALLGYWSGVNCSYCQENYFGSKCQTYFNQDSIRLDSNGRGLTISTTYPDIVSIQCKDLIADTSILGSGAVCNWNGANIKVTFGSNHSIKPGNDISINVRVFEKPGLELRTFKVLPPLETPAPIVKVSYYESYAPCEIIKLDASQSYISIENIELFYKWTISPSANLLNSTTNIVTIDNPSHGNYTVSLVVSTLFNQSEPFIFTISVNVPLPTIEIVDSDQINGIQTSQVPLKVKQLVKYTGCSTNDKLNFDNVKIEWTQVKGNSIFNVVNNNLILTSFETLDASQFIFTVRLTYLNSVSSATVTINTIEDNFAIVLYQTDLTSEQTTLNVEIQPATMVPRLANVSRIWTCKNPNVNCDSSVINKLQQNPQSEIINLLKSSPIDLSLQILSKKSEISISYPPPKVIIPLLSVLSINPPRTTLSASETLSVQLLISVDGQVDNIDSLIDISWTLKGSTQVLSKQSAVYVDMSNLTPGSEYTLQCSVTSLVSNQVSTYSYTFKVSDALPKCECSISPSSGYPLETLFTFTCPSTCITSDTSLKFSFKDSTSGSIIPLSQGKKTQFSTKLPYTGKSSMDIYFTVFSVSAKSDFISKVSINLKSISPIEWKKVSNSWITTYKSLAAGDPQKVVYSYAQMTSDAMRSLLLSRSLRSLSEMECLNGGSFIKEYGLCQCQEGFKKANCQMSLSDWKEYSSMRWDFQSLILDSIKYELQNDVLTDNSLTVNLAFLSNSISVFDEVPEDMLNECLSVFDLILKKIESTSQLSVADQVGVVSRFLDLVVSTHVSLYGNDTIIYEKIIDYTNKISLLSANSLVSGVSLVSTKYSSVVSSKLFPTELSNKVLTLNDRNERVSFGSGMVKYIQNVNLRKPLIATATTLYTSSSKLNETIAYLPNGNSTLTSRILNYRLSSNFTNQNLIVPVKDQVISFTFHVIKSTNNSITRQVVGDKILTTNVNTFYSCISNVACSFEENENFKTCKCSLPSFVKLEETTNKTITLENMDVLIDDPIIDKPPITKDPQLEYLGLLSLLIIPIIIIAIILIIVKLMRPKRKEAKGGHEKELISV